LPYDERVLLLELAEAMVLRLLAGVRRGTDAGGWRLDQLTAYERRSWQASVIG
jgi:hypothetical protein